MFQVSPPTDIPQQSPSPPMDTMLTVPENIIMVTGRNGESKPRKMRASCDACSRAKVKCDKLRPMCHRCNNMSICCNYSPSMRLGKPRKNKNSDGTAIRDVSPAGSYGFLGARPDVMPRTNIHTAESSPEPTDPFYFCPATPEFYQDSYIATGFNDGQSPDFSDGSMTNAWSSEEQLMLGAPTDVFAPMPHFLTPQSPYGGHIRSDIVQTQPETFSQMEVLQSQPTAPDVSMGMQHAILSHQDKMHASPAPLACMPLPTPPPPAAFVSVPRHDCTSYAFQVLSSLHMPSNVQSSAVDFGSITDELPNWTDVLSIAKSAVESVHNLLDCPCSNNPHFSSTISLTISKILTSYQSITGLDERNIAHPRSAQPESWTKNCITMVTGNDISSEEMNLRTNIVLSELRKVEKLVDKFSERYCMQSRPTEAGIESRIFQAMEAELRTRVRYTFKMIMRTAPEEVRRQVAFHSQNRARVHTM